MELVPLWNKFKFGENDSCKKSGKNKEQNLANCKKRI